MRYTRKHYEATVEVLVKEAEMIRAMGALRSELTEEETTHISASIVMQLVQSWVNEFAADSDNFRRTQFVGAVLDKIDWIDPNKVPLKWIPSCVCDLMIERGGIK